MSKLFPSGVFTVLVTPFSPDGSIDYIAMSKWFKIQAKSTISGLVIMGTTSENCTIGKKDQIKILSTIKMWNDMLSKPKFLVFGVGGNDTNKMIQIAKLAVGLCDGFMVTVPSYNKPTQKGIYEHFKAICLNPILKLHPIIMYNVPSRTGVNMEVSTISSIFNDFSNVVAIKEASGSISQLIQIRSQIPKLQVFAGDDLLLLDFMTHGGCGVISVASNIIPQIICEIYSDCVNELCTNKWDKFYKLKLPELINGLFCESNPIPIKFLLYKTNVFVHNVLRLPMTSLDAKYQDKIESLLNDTLKLYSEYSS